MWKGGGLCRVDVGCVDRTCYMCKVGSGDGGGGGHFFVLYNSSERRGSVMVSTTA